MTSRHSSLVSCACAAAAAAAALLAVGVAPARAEMVQKPALAVSANDGRFTGYSAALPLDLSTDAEKTLLTARVAGDAAHPTYNLDLTLTRPTDETRANGRDLALGASWNARQAVVSSSLSRLIGFGFLPRANYVRVSMDMNAVQPVETRGRTPVTRANLRSALVLAGQDVGSIAFGGGSTGDQGVDLCLIRPLSLPAELTLSVRTEDERLVDSRVMFKLLKTNW